MALIRFLADHWLALALIYAALFTLVMGFFSAAARSDDAMDRAVGDWPAVPPVHAGDLAQQGVQDHA